MVSNPRSPEPQHRHPGQAESQQEEEGCGDAGHRGHHLQPLLAPVPCVLPGQYESAKCQPVQIYKPHLPDLPLAGHEQQLL